MAYYFNKVADFINSRVYVDAGPLEQINSQRKTSGNNTNQNSENQKNKEQNNKNDNSSI